jgi:GGDEF domain-containing protein
MIARSILGRIRVEDRAVRMGEFRFAVLAPETDGPGAATFSRVLLDVIRKRLMTLGYEVTSFSLAVGYADYPNTARTAQDMLGEAARALAPGEMTTLPGATPGQPAQPPKSASESGPTGPASTAPG